MADRLSDDSAITALVNNAGVAAGSKLIESDVDSMDQIIQLNVAAFTRVALAAARAFVARGNRPHHQHRLRRGACARDAQRRL